MRNRWYKGLIFCVAVTLFVFPAYAGSKTPGLFQVTIKVDFGPSGKPAHEEKLLVEEETTPKEAVSQVFPIRSGKSCCSLREVIEIDGVAVDAEKKRWWICLVNGNKKDVSPQKTTLKAGDVVEWQYIEST